MATRFTRHAFKNVSARLFSSHDDIAKILDYGLFLPIGSEEGAKEKVHKLFFSKMDNEWFVAVQDEKNDEVITVLPIDYHNRWQISLEALMEAKRLVTPADIAEEDPGPTRETAPGIVQITVTSKKSNGESRHFTLCKFSFGDWGPIPNYVRPKNAHIIRKKLRESLAIDEYWDMLYAIMGKNGQKVQINLPPSQ